MILPRENTKSIQDLSFIFNIELGIPDNVFFDMRWHWVRGKYERWKEKVENEKKEYEKARKEIDSKRTSVSSNIYNVKRFK